MQRGPVTRGLADAPLPIDSAAFRSLSLGSRRDMVDGTANGALATMTVRGQAPMSELLGYRSRLNALTSGQGRYMIEFSHHEDCKRAGSPRAQRPLGRRDDAEP